MKLPIQSPLSNRQPSQLQGVYRRGQAFEGRISRWLRLVCLLLVVEGANQGSTRAYYYTRPFATVFSEK